MALLVFSATAADTRTVVAQSLTNHGFGQRPQVQQRLDLISRHGDISMLLCPVAPIHNLKLQFERANEIANDFVIPEWDSDVIHAAAIIDSAGVGNEQDSRISVGPRGHFLEMTDRGSPDAMEFGFNENIGPVPDEPAMQCRSAVLLGVYAHVLEALKWDSAGRYLNVEKVSTVRR